MVVVEVEVGGGRGGCDTLVDVSVRLLHMLELLVEGGGERGGGDGGGRVGGVGGWGGVAVVGGVFVR